MDLAPDDDLLELDRRFDDIEIENHNLIRRVTAHIRCLMSSVGTQQAIPMSTAASILDASLIPTASIPEASLIPDASLIPAE